mgnify:CR=1 FL=1
MNVLLIEDEVRVADFLARGLRAERMLVTESRSGTDGLELALAMPFDVIVLDLMLPGLPGLEVCQTLRQKGNTTPIIILTALGSPEDRIKGLRLGADDYMAKPFAFEELVLRIQGLARRTVSASDNDELRVADLVFNRSSLFVTRSGEQISLTAKELAVLELLMTAPEKVFSREKILNNVWGYSEDPLTNVVEVYVARLRKKIDMDGKPDLIENLRGLGYRIRDPSLSGSRLA